MGGIIRFNREVLFRCGRCCGGGVGAYVFFFSTTHFFVKDIFFVL